MAGRGPVAKPADQRQRRNRTTTRASLPAMGSAELRDALASHWRLFREDGKELMPLLAASPALGGKWLPRVREMWSRIWTGPQALEWLPPMMPVIERYAEMTQRFYAGEGDALRVDTALRALEDSLGLTPRAYRSLQWEVEKGEEAEEKVARRRQQRQTPAVTGEDVRDVLREVTSEERSVKSAPTAVAKARRPRGSKAEPAPPAPPPAPAKPTTRRAKAEAAPPAPPPAPAKPRGMRKAEKEQA